MLRKTRFVRGIILAPDIEPLSNISGVEEGALKVDSADSKIKTKLNDVVREVVTNSQTQELTNKTLTSPVINTGVSGTAIDTDGTLAANSDTKLASQKAVKTYVDAQIEGKDQADEILTNPSISGAIGESVQDVLEDHKGKIDDLVMLSGVAANSQDLGPFLSPIIPDNTTIKNAIQTLASGLETKTELNDFTFHVNSKIQHGVTSDLVGKDDAQTLTNKTITGADIRTPVRSDVKQDTLANLTTYALTATNGQIVYATDEKGMFQVVDGELVGIGGAGIVKLTAGENIQALDLVYISSTGDAGRNAGEIYKVDATNDNRVEVLGFATKSIAQGDVGEVQFSGNLKDFIASQGVILVAGKIYYASNTLPGTITEIPPSLNGEWIVPVGLAVSSDELVINPVASASAIYISDSEFVFNIPNNQTIPTSVTNLVFDPIQVRSFIVDYSIYRQDSLKSKAQVGQLRGVYNTGTLTWFLSDDYAGENSGVEFVVSPSGQVRISTSNFNGTSYQGVLKYTIRRTFTI
jgi:hypothetical protein